MGQNFENGAKFSKQGKNKKNRGGRHMRVKCASSARESCAGNRASCTNDAYASNARHMCTRTRDLPEAITSVDDIITLVPSHVRTIIFIATILIVV